MLSPTRWDALRYPWVEEKMIRRKNLPKFNDSSYVHFATTATYKNRPYFGDEGFCRILLEELDSYSNKYSFTLTGYVIMPDHVHLLVWWDRGERPELSISKIMQGIKGVTARRIIDLMVANRLEHLLQPTPRVLPSTPPCAPISPAYVPTYPYDVRAELFGNATQR